MLSRESDSNTRHSEHNHYRWREIVSEGHQRVSNIMANRANLVSTVGDMADEPELLL